MPWEDAQLVATQVANNKGGVRRGASIHVAEHVMQVKLLVIMVAPPSDGHLEVAPVASVLAAAMWLQPELAMEVSQEASASARGHHTPGAKVWLAGVGWDASPTSVVCPRDGDRGADAMDVALAHKGLQLVPQANPPGVVSCHWVGGEEARGRGVGPHLAHIP